MKKYLKKKINWDIKNPWFNWKYIITLKSMSQEFKLKNIGETRNYLLEEIEQNELLKSKHKKVFRILSYIEHIIILASTVNGCM